MKRDFWHSVWQNNRINFHQPNVNPYLQKYWPTLGLSNETVFVPLCGKSKDMMWLSQQGHPVFGVELSRLAVEQFYADHRLQPDIEDVVHHQRFSASGIELWVGDFFDLTAEEIGHPAAAYDRASLIALPPLMRAEYAAKFAQLMGKGSRTLLFTIDYPQEKMDGPPFAVSPIEVELLYEKKFKITHLRSRNILDRSPRFAANGMDHMNLEMFVLEKMVSDRVD
ncbi:MAG: thiopurine S-methyltransferase [Ardenticatenaceae bacterium]|nr:thiopurine S-methyltransferase [Ardenticatenaceae bacterium]